MKTVTTLFRLAMLPLLFFTIANTNADMMELPPFPGRTIVNGENAQLSQYDSRDQKNPPQGDVAGKELTKPAPNTQSHQNQENHGKKHSGPPQDSQWWFNLLVTIFTGLLVVVALIQAFIFFYTLKATEKAANAAKDAADAAKKSSDTAEKALTTLERPFVFVKEVKSLSHLNPGNGKIWWSLRPMWENSGNTPTRELRINVNRYLGDSPLPGGFDFPSKGESIPTLIGPKHTIGGDDVIAEGDDLAQVRDGKKYFYIWGWAKYRDVFEGTKEHVTRFCYRVTLLGDPTRRSGDDNIVEMKFSHHPQHNCSDEECERQDRETKRT